MILFNKLIAQMRENKSTDMQLLIILSSINAILCRNTLHYYGLYCFLHLQLSSYRTCFFIKYNRIAGYKM